VEAWKSPAVEVASGTLPQAVPVPTNRIDGCVGARYAVLGLCTRGLDRADRARHDPAIVWRGLSSGIRAALAASVGLESAEAGATCPRKERGGHRSLASRILAATKKRASNVKLAWFFSMKAGICCSRCGAAFGRRREIRPFSERGIDGIGLRPSPRSPGRPRQSHLILRQYYDRVERIKGLA
jgi:hypothetical protein